MMRETANLLDLFSPDDGYNIKYALATTYSLDVRLVMTLLQYVYGDYIKGKPFLCHTKVLKDAAENDGDRLTVFYQHNKMTAYPCKKSGEQIYFDRILSSVCIPVEMRGANCFHPKIILVCFRQGENEEMLRFRIGISSKNLTPGDMNEIIMMGEAVLKDGKKIPDALPPKTLEDFIDFLDCFEFVGDGDKMEICFQNPRDKTSSLYKKMNISSVKSLVAVSPGFDGCDDMFRDLQDKHFYTFSGKEDDDSKTKSSHTKMYVMERDDGSLEIWAGSANCTKNGLGYSDGFNYECMVKTVINDDLTLEDICVRIRENGYTETDISKLPQYADSDFDESGIEKFINDIESIEMGVKASSEAEQYKCELTIKMNKSSEAEYDVGSIQCIYCGSDAELNQCEGGLFASMDIEENQLSNMVIFQKRVNEKVISRCLYATVEGDSRDLFEKLYRDTIIHSDQNIIDTIKRTMVTDEAGKIKEGTESPGKTISFSDGDQFYEILLKCCAYYTDTKDGVEKLRWLVRNLEEDKTSEMIEQYISENVNEKRVF